MTILSVTENNYNLFWNDKDWASLLICGISIIGTLVFNGK